MWSNKPVDLGYPRVQVLQLQQHSRIYNVEIFRVPFSRNEDIACVILKLMTTIKVPFSPTDLSAAHRLLATKRSPHPTIIVKFISRSIKK